MAAGSELGLSNDAAVVQAQAWQQPPRRSRRRSSGGGSWQQRLTLLRVRVIATDIVPNVFCRKSMAEMRFLGKLFSGQIATAIVPKCAGAIQRLRDEEAAAVEAEDFERAADLSAGLDAAGRDAGTAATAAREAEAACESASQRRSEVSSPPEIARRSPLTLPCHGCVRPIYVIGPMFR